MTGLEITLTLTTLLFFGATVGLIFKLFYYKGEVARLEALQIPVDRLEDSFRRAAQEALTANSEQFLLLAKTTLEKENSLSAVELEKKQTEIRNTLNPLKQLIEDYQKKLQTIEIDRERSFTTVETELKKVYELGMTLSRETTALKNALKRPNVRGRWGELQLRNCIELAGMSEFADVSFQDEHVNANEQRLRPDMTVRMPGGRTVIVDAKTPLDAFLSALEEVDTEKRAAEFLRHARHIKEHIKDLSKRAYPEHIINSADFTILFLPNESFLYAALEAEPDLVEFALQKKVLIATPPTLIGLLKVIRYGWNEARLAENAQRISETGAELHKRLCEFVDSFLGIGKHLNRAVSEYESGLTRLRTRLVKKAAELEALGAKSGKQIALSPNEDEPALNEPADKSP